MAKVNVAQSAAQGDSTSHDDLDFGRDAERVRIALSAVFQADALVRLLMTARDDMEDVVAGFGSRLLELSSIAMTALDDQMETTADVAARMYGKEDAANDAKGV